MAKICISSFVYLFPLVLIPLTTANTGNVQVVTFSMRKLAFSTNQFGIDLYRALNMTDQNIALCPFCIGSSLAMVLLGAEGTTAMALRQALYLWGMHPQEIHLAYHDLIAHLGVNLRAGDDSVEQLPAGMPSSYHFQTRDVSDPISLKMINSVYIQRHFAIRYPYQFYMQRYYNTSVHPLDFVMNAEESMKHINSFFERVTEGRTKHILSHVPSPSTNLLLLNALLFKGTLDMNMTRIDFRRSHQSGADRDERQATAPVMLEARKARVRYGTHEYLNCSAVEVPFKGGLISLVALLPKDPGGMALLETRISAQRLNDIINNMQVKRVNYQMPRIIVEQVHGNLTKALYNLGLVDIFTPGYASLFGISNFGWLHVTNVTHASLVEVKEPDDSIQGHYHGSDGVESFALDKPFLWFIMDNITGLAIAMGKVVRPDSGPGHRQHG